MRQKKIKKIFSPKLKSKVNSNGASLLELMVVMGIMGILVTANQGMFQSTSKAQRSNMIKAEMLGIDFRVKTVLRSQQGCMDTLGGNGILTSTDISSKNDFAIAQKECLTKGTPLKFGFIKKKFNMSIGETLSNASGVSLIIRQARVIFLEKLSSPNNPDVDALVCYQISTQGMKEGSAFGATDASGQITKWHYEPISVKNIYDPILAAADPNSAINPKTKITACNSDISSVTSANCTSLGGEFVERTNECSSINVNVAKDDKGKIIDTSPLIAGGSAITAQGNLSSSGNGVLCGSLHVGVDDNETKIPTFCGDNLKQEDSGNLYVGKNITAKESIMTDTGIFASNLSVGYQGSGKAIIDNTLEVPNSLTAVKGLVETESLSVKGSAEFSQSANVKGTLKVDGKADLNTVVVTDSSISSDNGLKFFSSSGGDHVFYSKIKAIGDDSKFDTGGPDYLATMTYVNRLMLSKMTDEDRQKLFNELIKSAEQTGVDKVAMYAVAEKLRLISGLNQVPHGDSWMCKSGYSFKRLVKYCGKSTCYIGADCQPIQEPSASPNECSWQSGTGTGKIVYFSCNDSEKSIVSGSCHPEKHNPDIESSYFYVNKSGSTTSNCTGNTCNSLKCVNEYSISTTGSILCCKVGPATNTNTAAVVETDTQKSYYFNWDITLFPNYSLLTDTQIDLINKNPELQTSIFLDDNISQEIINTLPATYDDLRLIIDPNDTLQLDNNLLINSYDTNTLAPSLMLMQ